MQTQRKRHWMRPRGTIRLRHAFGSWHGSVGDVRSVRLIVALVLGLSAAAATAQPSVVASIRPIHSLAAGVMGDVGIPELIVRGYGSPHVYQMRPSEARALAAADVVLWMGEALETFMAGPILNLNPDARVVSLLETDGLDLHPARRSNRWISGHDHESDDAPADPHVWLAPDNARAMVDSIARVLSEVDPEHAGLYAANSAAVKSRISTMSASIEARLSAVAEAPFIVFHDSMHYFESAFDLHSVGAVTLDPDRQPGAGSLRALTQLVDTNGVVCIVVEPQFTPVLADTLAAGAVLGRAEVDPIGTDQPAAADSYFEMMHSNAENLAQCLGGR